MIDFDKQHTNNALLEEFDRKKPDPIKLSIVLNRKGVMGWVCPSVRLSRLYCSTWKTICAKEIEETARNASWQL
jgi:hypothetical protein